MNTPGLGNMLSFTVQIPHGTLEDLALNLHGVESIDGASARQLAALMHGAVLTGLKEALGEDVEPDEVVVIPS